MYNSFLIFVVITLTSCAVSSANISTGYDSEGKECPADICSMVLSANHGTYKPVLKIKFSPQVDECY